MAKPQANVIIERFRITAECDQSVMGLAVAALTRLGIEDLSYELITDEHTFGKNAAHKIPGPVFAFEWMTAGHPSFKIKELVAHFVANGRTAAAAYNAAKILTKDNKTQRLEDGTYYVSKVHIAEQQDGKPAPLMIEGPKKKATGKRAARTGTSPLAEIIAFIKKRKSFTTEMLKEVAKMKGFREKAVYGAVNNLVTKNMVKRLGEPGSGKYEVLQPPAAKKMNGAMEHANA